MEGLQAETACWWEKSEEKEQTGLSGQDIYSILYCIMQKWKKKPTAVITVKKNICNNSNSLNNSINNSCNNGEKKAVMISSAKQRKEKQ